jgi:hypothetical protein
MFKPRLNDAVFIFTAIVPRADAACFMFITFHPPPAHIFAAFAALFSACA